MNRRRGMTLLEVAIATAMLALIASACLPLIQRASALLATEGPTWPLHALDAFADAYVAEHATTLAAPDEFMAEEVTWTDVDGAARTVHANLLRTEGADHAWLTLTCEGRTVIRWLPEPENKDGTG